MQNRATVAADHDARPVGEVLAAFLAVREATLTRLDGCPADFFGRTAFHERLQIQKRVVDTCVFFADHDDHHLALVEAALRCRGRR